MKRRTQILIAASMLGAWSAAAKAQSEAVPPETVLNASNAKACVAAFNEGIAPDAELARKYGMEGSWSSAKNVVCGADRSKTLCEIRATGPAIPDEIGEKTYNDTVLQAYRPSPAADLQLTFWHAFSHNNEPVEGALKDIIVNFCTPALS